MNRCQWATSSSAEQEYHDNEWGIPVHDDRLLFEMLTLEGAQSGLSWATILNKRSGYLKAFDNFDIHKVSKYSPTKIEELLLDTGIVRHKLKIKATVSNAKCVIDIQKEFGSFDKYIWSFVDYAPIDNGWTDTAKVPSSTPISDALSKDLKKRGFKFIGSTTCYAFMQAIGMVNDHITSCFRYSEVNTYT